MKSLATSLLIGTTIFAPVAFAHHSYKGEAVAVSAAPYNWSGFYAGLNAGVVNHTMDITDNQATTFNATLQQVSNPRFTGGFQVGYRHQLDLTKTSGVFGAEFSANFSNTTFNKTYGSPFALYQIQVQNELKNLCMLQLTAGIAADRFLLFLAAGMSWANITGTVTDANAIAFFDSFNLNNKPFGTAIGGGVEYAFSDAFSARIKVDVITPNTYTVSNGTGGNFQIANNIVQGTFGVNYDLDKARWFPFKS